jgi:integrase
VAYVYSKRGTWYAGYKDEHGTAKQIATRAHTKAEARRIAEEHERKAERIRLGLETRDAPLTLGELWAKWHEAKALNASADTDEIRWRVHLAPRFGATPLTSLTPVELEAFLHAKLDGLSIQSVHHLRLLVGRLYNWAHRKNLYSGSNPAERVDLPAIVGTTPRTAAPEVVEKLLAIAPEPYRTIYAICIYAGLRSDEVLGLQRDNIDLARRLIIVSRQGKRESTKSGRVRVLPIVDQLLPLLEAACAGLTAGRLFTFPWKQAHWRQHILRKLYSLLDGAGLPRCTVHELRHTFITQLTESGVDPRAAQALAGHSDLKTTARYIHLRDQYLATQIQKLSYGQKEGKA